MSAEDLKRRLDHEASVAFRRVTPEHLRRIAKRACAMQGLPEDHYDKLPPERQASFERGTASTLAALDNLGWRFELPPDW